MHNTRASTLWKEDFFQTTARGASQSHVLLPYMLSWFAMPGLSGPIHHSKALFRNLTEVVIDDNEEERLLGVRLKKGYDTDDDDDNSDGDSIETLLSDSDDEYEHHLDQHLYQNGSLQQQCALQQKRFDQRDRILNKLSRKRNPRLMALIRKREVIVRRQERELLLLQYADEEPDDDKDMKNAKAELKKETSSKHIIFSDGEGDSDSNIDSDDDSTIWHDTRMDPVSLHFAETESGDYDDSTILNRVYEVALMELFVHIPAALSLVVHSLAHACMYDVVEIYVEEFKKLVEMHFPMLHWNKMNLLLSFSVGLLMLRLSGLLYWWLNDTDFDAIKIDFHNRYKLGCWDTKIMMWIKRRKRLRCLMYMVGYHICYKAMFDAYEQFYYYYNQSDEILFGLPSNQEEDATESACNQEWEEQMANDYDYLWKALNFRSFERYWECWAENITRDPEDTVAMYPLLGPLQSALFCGALFVACIMLLRTYGFSFFDKY